jgi:hypothetical protein
VTRSPGAIAAVGLGVLLLAFALSVDFPKTAQGFKGDEATYYSLAHSLARDADFTFERKDLVRVWEEFPGPEGIFLKRGKAIRIEWIGQPPFFRWVKSEDPKRSRLYYAKSYIYPLAASPFVFLFGTNGFLVLHALLLALDLFVVYLFLAARSRAPATALVWSVTFLGASVVPIYFVWLTPELFNFSLALYALFLWSYKEVAADDTPRLLRGAGSDYAAAALIGVLTFSKPPHAILMGALCAMALLRRQWGRVATLVAVWAIVSGVLFAGNAAITGEFNYQGGDRKTFYSYIGFPFANERETFENIGPVRGRESIMVGDVLANAHTFTVFRHNIVYFVLGRSAGLVPYFFPGIVCLLLFLVSAHRRPWQWLAFATIVGTAVAFVLVWPFTYSGGGGPVGNRYFLSFYPLFLLLIPPAAGLGSAATAFAVGALFTAKILLNPFYASFNPGEHLKAGPLRWLPLELTLLNDLPMASKPERVKQPLGGDPPVWAYFPDDNAFSPEPNGNAFWVKGKSRAEVILRAPVVNLGGEQFVSKSIVRLTIEVQNGADPATVTVATGREKRVLAMKSAEVSTLTLGVESGVPYHRDENPTSYLYRMTIATNAGFVPFLDAPGSSDSRFLGARIRVVPEYADAETSTWRMGPAAPAKE